jgi:Mg-chelatase subunit ChlD
MSAAAAETPERLRFFASYVAGRSVSVGTAAPGELAHTDGQVILVSAGRSLAEQRREMLVQSALLGAGSLDLQFIKALRGRPGVARRYLVLEAHRVLAALAPQIPLAATLCPPDEPLTSSANESLQFAKSRQTLPEAPDWFGVIRPSRLLTPVAGPGAQASNKDLHLDFDAIDMPEAENDGDEEQGEESKILKLFENPLFNSQAMADFFRKLFGTARAPGEGSAGAEMQVRSVRKVNQVGANARPLPTQLRITDNGAPGAAMGIGGVLYPEWDVHNNQYKPDWCRVFDFPLTTEADFADAAVQRDEVLRQRLTRIGLGPKVLRRRPDGEDLDIEALIDLAVDLNAGHSPAENIYLERRKLARNLGVLILLDASGSAIDADPDGLSVHDHQRRAAATLAATLEELGDRVAVYGFRSNGRSNVHLMGLKPFAQRFSAGGRARLNQLEPSGYTRLGAGIRGAGEILKKDAGTPNRLLLVLSDGFPYDDGYEHRYAEADAHKALEELRGEGVACLCLSIGASTSDDALHRVFGSANFASAPSLGHLSPRMDELFLSALKELAVANPWRQG